MCKLLCSRIDNTQTRKHAYRNENDFNTKIVCIMRFCSICIFDVYGGADRASQMVLETIWKNCPWFPRLPLTCKSGHRNSPICCLRARLTRNDVLSRVIGYDASWAQLMFKWFVLRFVSSHVKNIRNCEA